MALQMRRGLDSEFDETQMLPGEWAVATDKMRIWMCCNKQAGGTVEIPTMIGIRQIEDKCKDYADDAKYSADNAKDSADEAEGYKDNAFQSAQNADEYYKLSKSYAVGTNNEVREDVEDNAKFYKEWVENAFDRKLPKISMDFTTGELLYVGGVITFDLDLTTGLLDWYM